MKHEFVVWTDRTRLPTLSDVIASLQAAGFGCRVEEIPAGKPDPSTWAGLKLESDIGTATLTCHVATSVPSPAEIAQMRESYELLPFQLKNAARRYTITSDEDDYGQATPFHAQVVATLARLSKGVIDDPQEGGLMMLEEFEDYMST